MRYDVILVERVLSEVFKICNAPDSVYTVKSDDFKSTDKVILIKHVMALTSAGYLSCHILKDEPPIDEHPSLHDFSINGLHPKGKQLLTKIQKLGTTDTIRVLRANSPYESIDKMVSTLNHLCAIKGL